MQAWGLRTESQSVVLRPARLRTLNSHGVVPEFEDDFRPSTAKNTRKIIWFGEDQRGRPTSGYQHYRPIGCAEGNYSREVAGEPYYDEKFAEELVGLQSRRPPMRNLMKSRKRFCK